jgi:hypothetical protein
MKKFKNLTLLLFAVAGLSLSGCLHIVEEVTFRNNGSGSYQMVLDMSEVKGMMDMLQGMGEESEGDSTGVADDQPVAPGADNPMSQLGSEISGVAQSLKGVAGLTNVIEINDTAAFKFGYAFDFASVDALNKALRIINKEKYDAKTEEVFKFKGKSFERLASADLGEEIKKALAESTEDSEVDDESSSMMKMFFADMSYQQVYRFPDREIKKSSNKLSEISDGAHTLSITIKPFDEEQQKQKASVATVVKLK